MKFNEAGIKNSVLPTIDQSKKSVSTAKDTLLNIIVPSDFSSASMIKNSIPNNLNDINSTLKNTYDWLNLKIADRHKMELKNEQLFSSMTFNSYSNQNIFIEPTPPKVGEPIALSTEPVADTRNWFEKAGDWLVDTGADIFNGISSWWTNTAFPIISDAIMTSQSGNAVLVETAAEVSSSGLGDWFSDKWSDLKKFWNNGKIIEVQATSISYLDELNSTSQEDAQHSMDTFYGQLMDNKSIYDQLNEQYTNSKVILDGYKERLEKLNSENDLAYQSERNDYDKAIEDLKDEYFGTGVRAEELKKLGITSFDGLERYVASKKKEFDKQKAYFNTLKLAYNLIPYSYVSQNEDYGSYSIDEVTLRKLIGNDYDYMTEEQIGIYNYIYCKEGKYKAEDYFTLLADSINQVKGLEDAGNFMLLLEGKNAVEKAALIAAEGLGDGALTFLNGLADAVNPDGSLSQTAYRQMYILQALSNQLIDPELITRLKGKGYTEEKFIEMCEKVTELEKSDYTEEQLIKMCEENLYDLETVKMYMSSGQDPEVIRAIMASGEYKAIYKYIYKFSTSVGNMAIPIVAGITAGALSKNVKAGTGVAWFLSHLGVISIGISAGGSSMNSAIHDGFSGPTSLMFGIANGLSESVIESLGNVPGLNPNFAPTLTGFLKEAGTEAVQEYLSIYYDSVFLGKTISISDGAAQLTEAAIMGFLMSAIMGGGETTLNIAGKTIVVSAQKLYEIVDSAKANGGKITAAQLFVGQNIDAVAPVSTGPNSPANTAGVALNNGSALTALFNNINNNNMALDILTETFISAGIPVDMNSALNKTWKDKFNNITRFAKIVNAMGKSIYQSYDAHNILHVARVASKSLKFAKIFEQMTGKKIDYDALIKAAQWHDVSMSQTKFLAKIQRSNGSFEYQKIDLETAKYSTYDLTAADVAMLADPANPAKRKAFLEALGKKPGINMSADMLKKFNQDVVWENLKEGDQIYTFNPLMLHRLSHAPNSSLAVLENASEIRASGTDPAIMAMVIFAHTKSNSGIGDLSNPAQWQAAIEELKKQANIMGIDASCLDSLTDVDGKIKADIFDQLHLQGLALRFGDAKAAKTGQSHIGGKFKLPEYLEGTAIVTNPDGSIKTMGPGSEMVNFGVSIPGVDNPTGMAFIFGEHAVGEPGEAISGTNVLNHTFDLNTVNFPNSTWVFGIKEKIDEFITDSSLQQEITLSIPAQNQKQFDALKAFYDAQYYDYIEPLKKDGKNVSMLPPKLTIVWKK